MDLTKDRGVGGKYVPSLTSLILPVPFQRLLLKGFSVFSVYGNVLEGRERLTVTNSVMLTRVTLHGPPSATEESATLAKEAMDNYHQHV